HDFILSYACRPSLDTESASALILDFPATRTVEQILAEFKFRAVECHPNKNPENSKHFGRPRQADHLRSGV
uniref:J domain-containing protein n=1 Tax=Theropithecus gelada TaxID=9565 RepID=A0A8D2EV02_THEGE